MKKVVRVLWLIALVLGVSSEVVLTSPSIDPIDTKTIPSRTFNDIAKLGPTTYMLGGGRPIGEQPWETEPGITVYGETSAENIYNVDGAGLSDTREGTVSSFACESIEEVEVKTGGYEAEYGGTMAGILDYRNGGTVVNVITKSGGNEYRGEYFAHANESLNDLSYDETGRLWGAGSRFEAEGPMPVLGYFDEAGIFVPLENPFEVSGGFFNGVEFMGIGLAFGNTVPNDVPTKPLMAASYDEGRTWVPLPGLPWTYGTIDTAHFIDPLRGWVGGETPDGGAFAYTQDGGKTWMKQTMPDSTYIWDMEIVQIWPECSALQTIDDPMSTPYIADPKILGAALGTHYLDDGSKESIVFRTLDGRAWEELWRVDGYGGDIFFGYRFDGEVAIIQNGLDGNATFSRYAAHDFFGTENLIVCGEITYDGDMAYTNEPLPLQLSVYGPWGKPIKQDTVHWSADYGELVVDPDDPMLATFTASEPVDVTVTCTLPDQDVEIGRRFEVRLKN